MAQPPDPSWTPIGLLTTLKGMIVAGGSVLATVLMFASRRDASRNQARSIDIAERRESLDERTAARVAAEAEIARKDKEIAWWKQDSIEGWTGLNKAVRGWDQDNHNADNNETMMLGIISRANLPVPTLRKRDPVPDAQTLAGRNRQAKEQST